MRTLPFFFSQLRPFAATFWGLLLVGALDGAAGFSIPILLAELTKSPSLHALTHTALPLISLCAIASLVCQWCLRRWGEALHTWFGNELRTRLFREVESLSTETLAQHHSGYIAALVNQVAGSIGSLATSIVWLVGHLVVTLSLFFVFTARESVQLAWANLALLAVFVSVSVYLSRRMVRLADHVNRTSALVAERFIDFLTNISTVKKLGVLSWAEHKIRRESLNNNSAINDLQRFHANRWALLHSIFYASLLGTIAVLLSRIETGSLAPSALILFVAGFTTVRSHAERLSELIKGILESDAYVGRLSAILKEKQSVGIKSISELSQITLRDVTYRYPESEHVVRVPECEIKAGERILITGRSGQGKSTFLALVAHQRAPVSGECMWNNTPYSELDSSLTQSFALVSQEAELFNMSLRENLCMNVPASEDAIISLLAKLELTEVVTKLPAGLDTPVGEKGLRLSAGQKQRINIARAILLQRPVLLLDEPTSHLDPETEAAVIRCLAELDQTTTMIIVSHQPALRALCTRELIIEDGVMREA